MINPRMPALAKSARAALKVFQGHSRGELNQLLFGKVPAQFCIKLITHIRRRIGHGVRHASKATSAGANPSMRPSRIAAISSSLNPYILPPAEFASIQKEQPTRTAVRSVNNMRCRCGTGAFCPKSHSRVRLPRTLVALGLRFVAGEIPAQHFAHLFEHLPH